jgi:CBS domain-containing protein
MLVMIDVFVGQIMTEELVTVERSQTLADASVAMTDDGIKSVVVSDPDGRPIGILTSTDFLRMAADGNDPIETSVSEYMTADIVTTTADTTVNEAANLMMNHDISHLPVVRNDDRLTGIVTTTDVATYVSDLEDLPQQ